MARKSSAMIVNNKAQEVPDCSLILASKSVYRKQQLQQLGVDFTQVATNIDESLHSKELPADRARRLAEDKARTVFQQYPNAVVIGSDQVCACDDIIYRKPEKRQKNIQQLQQFSGQQLIFYTAVSVIGHRNQLQNHVNQTHVQFRDLSHAEISRYVDKEQAFDCAGGFKMEQLGLSLMTSVKSDDPSALMGLPLIQLCAFLRELGVEIP